MIHVGSDDEFRDLTRPLIGMGVSHVWRGAGTAIFLELGELTHGTGRNAQGEASIMIEWSWRVERPQSVLFGSFSSLRKIEGQLQRLTGLTVEEIAVSGRLPEIVVRLSGNLWLHSFTTVEGQPEWSVLFHDGTWLGSRRGRLIRETTGDT